MALASGTRLGSYEIVAPLGAGGMGEVYRALDTRLGREVALKILPDAFARDSERLARFEREARTVAGFNHPSIVTLHSIEADGGVRFLTMELVEGQTLDRLIEGGGLSLKRVLELVIPLTDALVAAHARGVVHRDLKPANVMVTREGRVKVLDFGLAKSTRDQAVNESTQALTVASPLSGVGHVLGTVPYMAPEQLRGELVDGRTDLFALGILAYELATGRRPFVGATFADVSSAILRDSPEPLAIVRGDLPRDLDRIVSRCLAKSPRDRYQSAAELYDELRRLERGAERSPEPTPKVEHKPSIAVLPFNNMSADPENEYFSDGLSEELLNVLAKIPELKVTGRTSSFAFKGKQEDLREIGQKLGVATLLEGSVRKAGNRVRITAQLIKVADGFHLWSETYDRVLDDIFAVQDDIARSVSSALHVTLLGKARPSARVDPECYELVLRGNSLSPRFDQESLEKAVSHYRAAIAKCPDYAPAWSGLARARAIQGGHGLAPAAESFSEVREALQRALAIDDALPEAHEMFGWVLLNEHQWERAGEEFRRAVSLGPGDGKPLAGLAAYEAARGRADEAVRWARQAVEHEPLAPFAYLHRARIETLAGNYERARESYLKTLELSPDCPAAHASIGLIDVWQGRFEEAVPQIEKERSTGYRNYALAIAWHSLGKKEASDEALAQVLKEGEEWAVQIANAHAWRGELDQAFEWLDRALAGQDAGLWGVRLGIPMRKLHADPRWARFLREAGFES